MCRCTDNSGSRRVENQQRCLFDLDDVEQRGEAEALRGDTVKCWTDGSCIPNPGPGGWAVVFEDGRVACGSNKHTTCNEMEMYAVLGACQEASPGSILDIHTDSTLVIGWMTLRYKMSRPNIRFIRDEISRIKREKELTLRFSKVKAHSGNEYNEAADQLAGQMIHLRT